MKDQSETGSVRHFAMFVTIAIAIFAGGSGVVLVQHLFARMEPPHLVEDSTPASTSDPRLAEALIQLAKELRESRASAPALNSPLAEPSQRSVATPSGESALAELAAAVRELREALQHSSGGPSPTTLSPVTRPRDDLRTWLPELAADVPDREAAYTHQHMFWTEQQILDSYGMPDSIAVQDGVSIWRYEDPEYGKRSFHVCIFQGRVIFVG